jgi:pimeloyl-ACP methyl ester carboxylesterase
MTTPISRHFATVGQRQVHYRRAGNGPMVFLLNQSPNSSTEYIPLIRRLAQNHTVIAPDTPGNGLSDPLTIEQPGMGDFADAVVGLFDELGVDKAPVYGFHTGGLCALEMARRHPDRVVMTISNGYLHMDQAQIDAILENYFAELTIDWSGSHLTFVWARMRNQYVFFPWFRTEVAARMDYDMPPPEYIHEAVMEILRAGDHYRGPYRAAFVFSAAEAVQQAKAPAVVMTSKEDVLFPGMARMPTPAASVRTMEPETHAASEDLLAQLLLETPGPSAPPVARTKPLRGKTHAEFIAVEGGSLYARRNTDADGRPVVFQHASASSSWGCDRLMQHFIGRRPVVAIDLPGNGESEDLIGANEDIVARQAAILVAALDQLGYSEVDFYGDWGGGTVGVELARQAPDLVKHLAVPNLVFLDKDGRQEYAEKYTPELEIDENGLHFIKVWNMVRDQALYAPWFERKKTNIIRSGEPDIAPEVIHRRTLDLLKCGDRYRALYAAHFNYPIEQKLKAVQCPLMLGSPQSSASQRAAALGLKNYQLNELPSDDRAQLADALMAFFDS